MIYGLQVFLYAQRGLRGREHGHGPGHPVRLPDGQDLCRGRGHVRGPAPHHTHTPPHTHHAASHQVHHHRQVMQQTPTAAATPPPSQ